MSPAQDELLLVRTRKSPSSELEEQLGASGLAVRSVVLDKNTVAAIVAAPPSLVVLDVGPEDERLLDIAPRLVDHLSQLAPAVLAIIDAEDGALIERAFSHGVRDVVPRPVSGPLLKAKVQKNARRPGASAHQIGGYRIERILGRGGMGVVYLAERDSQRYALKVLDVGSTADIEALARFRREMETLRRLRGPGIPRFFEAGRTEDCFFYVMEYVEGETLSTLLRRRPIEEKALRTIVCDVAAALETMHAANLIHRDVKPPNVIVTRTGRGMLIDYGLAKFLDDFSLTRRDEVLGTMLYMSPEILQGDNPKPAADAFSLGMTALHAALGQDPVAGTASYVARRIMTGDVPRAADVLRHFSFDFVSVIDGLLTKDPARRLAVGEARRRLGGVDRDDVTPPSIRLDGARERTTVLALKFLNGESEGRLVDYRPPREIVLGRSKEADLEVFDSRVSRRHCSIKLDEGSAIVKDLGSANGTFVNGAAVKLQKLADGDVLRVAETEIRVEIAERSRTHQVAAFEPPPAETADAARIPGYELLRRIGAGATGAVFEARAKKSGEIFAVKITRPLVAPTPEDRQRFLREAATASALVHPNIVRIHERGEYQGAFYLVMELVRGETLKEHVARKGQLPINFALAVTRQIASALELARTCGIVHRDVKPENILIQEDGTAKLTDFGLAKATATAGESGLTKAGDLVGTLAYMAPEQVRSAVTADHRADVYSLGATLYFMLTAKPPFASSSSTSAFMKKILEEEPAPIATARSDVPFVVATLVQRCLKKNADERARAQDVVRLTSQLLSKIEDRTTFTD